MCTRANFELIANTPSLETELFLCFNCLDVADQDKYPTRSSKSRSSFSVEQVLQLERVFDRQKYLGSRDRQRLAEQLQMTETQVKKCFLFLFFHRELVIF